ncbi:hypothetical protein [Paenibacillus lentus]|uniref:Uncharacterized protein n=1 Tax=Paenibacillus lentus TaxID=1338368 RepID=A0A3S8RPM8_9BACL|nr:hypothetical protein [Paenibacillus lentus]AZK44799.1 hypothetical protein EIM92_00150 [Paenibacillus lentus]
MKTRFDETKRWVTSTGDVIEIVNMETTHLMNTIRMFAQKPYISMGIIVKDIERNAVCYNANNAWTPFSREVVDVKKKSINNITSMNEEEIIKYSLNSPLGKAMLDELQSRGVNIQNFIEMVSNGCESF